MPPFSKEDVLLDMIMIVVVVLVVMIIKYTVYRKVERSKLKGYRIKERDNRRFKKTISYASEIKAKN